MVQVLEAMIMGPVRWERRSLRLLIEVYETCRSRLQLRLAERIHGAELGRIDTMIVLRLFSRPVTGRGLKGAEAISCMTIDVFLILFRKVLLIFPDFVQDARALLWRRVFDK